VLAEPHQDAGEEVGDGGVGADAGPLLWIDGEHRLDAVGHQRLVELAPGGGSTCWRPIDVLAADAATGSVRELFSEVGDTFLRIHNDLVPGRRLGLWIVPDGAGMGTQILWLSERDGWKHLYLYDLRGRLPRP
jgi:hypothetical protein